MMPGMHRVQAKIVKGGGMYGLGVYAKKSQ
jgi:hypothetical protein